MKFILGFLVIMLCLHTQIHAGKNGEEKQTNFELKTGTNTIKKTPRQLFSDVMQQLVSQQDLVEQKKESSVAQDLLALKNSLPTWSGNIPLSIPLYVDFNRNDAAQVRASKFIKIAQLLRDMYEDYPINKYALYTFDTPPELRLDKAQRYYLASQWLLAAFNSLDAVVKFDTLGRCLTPDLLVMQADIARWAIYHLQVAGPNFQAFVFNLAISMQSFLARAKTGLANEPIALSQLALLGNAIIFAIPDLGELVMNGQALIGKSRDESLMNVANEMQRLWLSEPQPSLVESITDVIERIEATRELLPIWASETPITIPLYANLNSQDTPRDRAFKFIKISRLVRDMYEKHPVNEFVLFTSTAPVRERWPDTKRNYLVAQWLVEAFDSLQQLSLGKHIDQHAIRLQMEVATWALSQLENAGNEYLPETVQFASTVHQFAEKAKTILAAQDEVDRFDQLKSYAVNVVSKILKPLIWLAMFKTLNFDAEGKS